MVICLCVAIIAGRSDLGLVGQAHTCAAAYRRKLPETAEVCEREYQRTQDPKTGLLAAKALSKDERPADAQRVATRLLDTSVRSDALYLLGWIALDKYRRDDATIALDDAMTDLEAARELHRTEHRPRELALDDAVLASVRTERSDFADALRLLDECITLADDVPTRGYCHTIAVRTLVQVGYFSAVEKEIDIATRWATDEEASVGLEYQRGNFEQESGDHASAIAHFESVLRRSQHSLNTPRTITTELNLAYSLAERGRLDEAQLHLQNALLLDIDHKKEPERIWVAAQIAYRQHDLASAISLTEKYFHLLGPDDSVDRDDRIDVATLGARIELERGNLEPALDWARQGVKQAEFVRGTQSVLELRPWVLAKRRAPYQLLFTALARSGHVEAAAMVFDEWQGRTVQDALARPRPPASLDYRGMAEQLTKLGDWLRVASQAPIAKPPDQDSVLRTMGDIDLLALIVANGEVWRLTANHGPPQLVKLGAFAEIKELVDQFRGQPTTDVKRASDLGAWLLPDDAFRATREVLHVLVDGQLAGLPVAALRQGGTPLIALRPIVRVLRLPESRCVPMARPGHATVLGAPDATLPNAQQEAEQVAGLLHTTSKTGAAATSDALVDAKNDAVLHVAAHGTIGMDGAAIRLADRDVSALEISALRVAPSLAMLSACDAATADDLELAGSLAAGFLGAGSQHVVATLRPITDAGALEISTRFYREGGVADPARALEAVQSALVKSGNVDWPYFTVFGPDVCLDGTPGHQ